MAYKMQVNDKNTIRKGVTTSKQSDGNNNYTTQIKAYNAPLQVEVVYPYGIAASPPVGSVALAWNIANQPENVSALVYDPSTRFKSLAPGEYVCGNQETQTFIKFLESGDVEIKTNGKCTVIGDLVVTGDITVKGNALVEDSLTVGNDLTILDNTSPILISTLITAYNLHTHVAPVGGNTSATSNPV